MNIFITFLITSHSNEGNLHAQRESVSTKYKHFAWRFAIKFSNLFSFLRKKLYVLYATCFKQVVWSKEKKIEKTKTQTEIECNAQLMAVNPPLKIRASMFFFA